jgi:hypothetical protein
MKREEREEYIIEKRGRVGDRQRESDGYDIDPSLDIRY